MSAFYDSLSAAESSRIRHVVSWNRPMFCCPFWAGQLKGERPVWVMYPACLGVLFVVCCI